MKLFTTIFISLFIYAQSSYAQCFPDRHNTSWFDGWISCAASPSPNASRGEGHWILYDFNHLYKLGQMHVWNTNAVGFLDDGMKEVVIDISDDGVNWTALGQFQFEKGTGSTTYEGFDGPNLNDAEGRYLLITALSNWGGSCYGMSEIKIDVDVIIGTKEPIVKENCLSVNIFPNPITTQSKAYISVGCSPMPIDYTILDITGKILKKGHLKPIGNEAVLDLNLSAMNAGSYILSLKQEDVLVRGKFVKIK